MNDYSTLFTSGLMLLCDSAKPRSRQLSRDNSPIDDNKNALRSFLSLDMAESLRTFATGSSSVSSSRAHSRKPSTERHPRAVPSPAPSSSQVVLSAPRSKGPVSPASSRRRSLPQAKPAPLAELPVVPTCHARSRSDSAASQVLPSFNLSAPALSDSASIESAPACVANHKGRLAPSTLKLELSSAPTTPCSPFPTTPRSSRHMSMSMFSPLTPPTADAPWSPHTEPISPADTWTDVFASVLSPTTTESALGLHIPRTLPAIDVENVAPRAEERLVPKRARVRRDRHSVPSRSTSITASMRSSQGSVTTSYRRTQRSGALAILEGRVPRSEWMSDDEEASAASTKFRPGLSLMPSMDFKESEYLVIPPSVRNKLAPFRIDDQNCSFIDLSDDAASLAARRGISSLAS